MRCCLAQQRCIELCGTRGTDETRTARANNHGIYTSAATSRRTRASKRARGGGGGNGVCVYVCTSKSLWTSGRARGKIGVAATRARWPPIYIHASGTLNASSARWSGGWLYAGVREQSRARGREWEIGIDSLASPPAPPPPERHPSAFLTFTNGRRTNNPEG